MTNQLTLPFLKVPNNLLVEYLGLDKLGRRHWQLKYHTLIPEFIQWTEQHTDGYTMIREFGIYHIQFNNEQDTALAKLTWDIT